MTKRDDEKKLHAAAPGERPLDGERAEVHLRIMVERMVHEGRSERAIEAAVRRAA